jgi:hypothetical protein
MCTAAWPIQRARPRPRPCPLWPFDPSRRLKTTPRFWQQIRPHARTIAPTHKRTLTHASTPPATRADALANASRKHTHAQTPRRRKSPTRTNATRTAHAPTNARTDANDTPRGRDKCPRMRVHMHQHDTRPNTPTQHLKVRAVSDDIWHANAHALMHGAGGGSSPPGLMHHRLVLVSACLIARCSRWLWLLLAHTRHHHHRCFLSGPWWWPEKSRHDRKSAGALFWHLNWPDHPEVYIMGRVRPEKKNTPKKAVRCHFGPYLFDLGSGC